MYIGIRDRVQTKEKIFADNLSFQHLISNVTI